MSATGRKRKGASESLPGLEREVGRHPDDFYRTPEWATRGLLPSLRRPRTWIDCGAGDGAIARVIANYWPESSGTMVELAPDRAAAAAREVPAAALRVGDFCALDLPRVDLVIGNPPYGYRESDPRRREHDDRNALDFALRALDLVEPGGEVALLLRVGFVEGRERGDFLERHQADLALFPRRPSFTGGGNDATPYAWWIFGKGHGGRWWRLPDERATSRADEPEQLALWEAGGALP